MSCSLVILAAGAASRFGALKQWLSFGPKDELIMDYSIYDAAKSGFDEVVFVIQKTYAAEFESMIQKKWGKQIDVKFCYQTMEYSSKKSLENRQKPLGTGHAVMCLKGTISRPFVVINSDDLYGQKSFEKAYRFLNSHCTQTTYANVFYTLGKTMSINGEVTRGVCKMNHRNELETLTEHKKLKKIDEKILNCETNSLILPEAKVSMNFWCLHPHILEMLENKFEIFCNHLNDDSNKEFILPEIISKLISEKKCRIQMIPSESEWMGVTYKNDSILMKNHIQKLISEKIYPEFLY